jgi:hypothetical protein
MASGAETLQVIARVGSPSRHRDDMVDVLGPRATLTTCSLLRQYTGPRTPPRETIASGLAAGPWRAQYGASTRQQSAR